MNSLRLIYRKYNTNYKINKGKSSLTSLVACFIIGKVYCKAELTEDYMPVIE